MQVFARELIETHCAGVEWPDFAGRVALGESFVVETERFNRANGPLAVDGIRAGDALAVHVEAIEMQPPYEAPDGGPLVEGMGAPVPLTYAAGQFRFPQGVALRAKPSIGNVAVLPAPTPAVLALSHRDLGPPAPGHRGWGWRAVVNDPRGKHCHQDCQALMAGAAIHLRAQIDQAGLCLADVHGYIGQGELAFAAIEVAARVQLRVERSSGWHVDWPLVETPDEIMLCCSDTSLLTGTADQQYVDVVRQAYQAMRQVVAARLGRSISDANPIVAAALDIRNCALYGLGNFIQASGKTPGLPDRDIARVAALPKSVLPSANPMLESLPYRSD